MFDYQKSNQYFAQVSGKMEELCTAELVELGAEKIKSVYRGIYFTASTAELYKINYMSCLLTRVLAPLTSFPCKSTDELKMTASKIKWEEFLSLNKTFAITASVADSKITHSKYASLCLKDSIADYFRDKLGKRPDVDIKNPDVRFNLRIEKNKATVSIDTSGESLHKRGYRLSKVEAPMQEILAAAILQISGWNGEKPLWDCMCGSGTILAEALMHYCRIPAQYLRMNFGFFHMPDFNKATWESIKKECDKNIRPLPTELIHGSDISPKAIEIAKENLARLPFYENIELNNLPFQNADNFEDGVMITNPPYGIRMGEKLEAEKIFKELGDFIKQKCTGTSAFIYAGDMALRKSIGLKTSKRVHLNNGKLEGVLIQIDSFKGKRRDQSKTK